MTAPAGVSSGSAPEPVARAAADPQAAGAEVAEPTLAAAVPPLATEPAIPAAEPTLAAAVPPQATEPVLTAAGPAPAAAEPAATEQAPEDAAGEPHGETAADVQEPGPGSAAGEPAGPSGRRSGVRVLAVAATIVGILVLVGTAVAVLAVVTHGFRPKTVVTYREPAVFSLRAGECINSSPNGLSITVRSCTTPHDAEVFATFRLTGSSWPGSAAIQQDANNGCMSRVGGYLNPALASASFTQEYVFPDQEAWQAGVRTVVCEIRASSGQLTGSVRQAG